MGFPGDSVVKNPPANARDVGLIPGSGRSLEEKMATTPVFLPWGSHGQRSLEGCSPWGHRGSDRTEHAGAHGRHVWSAAV